MDALERLRRANPVPSLERPSWEAIEARLDADAAVPARAPRPARTRRTLLLAALLLLVLAAGAVAAGILLTGEPVPEPTPRPTPGSGTGTARPNGMELLPVTAADPDGGPPWGMRLVRTTRGLVCLQLGRRSGGQLGILGRDGAFGNDGRLHPISARAPDPSDCALPDVPARPVMSRVYHRLPASGRLVGCHPGVPKRGERIRPCPPGSERDVYVGVLGPEARSVTYPDQGRLATRRTSGPYGAYLIVLRSARGGPPSVTYGGGPERGLISVQYSGGRRCKIIEPKTGGRRPCSGPDVARPPARTDGRSVRTTVRARVRPSASGNRIEARFSAPAAIRDARSTYLMTLLLPPDRTCYLVDGTSLMAQSGKGPNTVNAVTNRNFGAGAPVRLSVQLHRACSGTVRGRIDLKPVQGSDPINAIWAPGRFVGRFTVRLP